MQQEVTVARALYDALKASLPPMPPKDALCHIGICPQERCGHCSRVKSGYDAIAQAETLLGFS